jgi:hypothetical protein
MVRINFTSGKHLDVEYNWEQLAPKFQLGGVRMFKPRPGILIPLNSQTIEMIEDLGHEEEDATVSEETAEPDEFSETFEATHDKPTEREPEEPVDLKDEKPMSAQEKQDEMLAYMKEMSECTHEAHDYYYTDSQVGRAKKPVRRYFPVCVKCGIREKFVKADSLTDEQKENAEVWSS